MSNNIRILGLATLVALSLGVSACETFEGAGRDIENAGENIQDAAN